MTTDPNPRHDPRAVLLVVYIPAHFSELIRAARLLRRSGRFAPVIWFGWPYREVDRDAAVCEAEDIAYLRDWAGSAVGADAAASAQRLPARTLRGRVRSAIRGALSALPFPFTAIRALAREGQQRSFARHIVARTRPAAVILAEDTVGYGTASVIKAAHEHGAPSLIIPFTIANALEPAEIFFDDRPRGMARWANRLAGRVYPKWVYEHRGRKLLRMPAEDVIAKEWWGLAPPLPWQMNSGSADAIAVESPVMDAYYRREGLPPPPLVVTGAMADDTLAANLHDAPSKRAALCAELSLPTDRRLLLCALPDDRFSVGDTRSDFADYRALVQFIAETLRALPGFAVVARLHPRSSPEAYRLAEELGLGVSRRDTAELVPLCDVYVASVSATIRWAIACGKPVVNYDLYRLRLTDYAEVPGVLRVEDRPDFVAVLQRLAGDAAFFEDVRARQEAIAPQWGTLDGKTGARILACLDGLIAPAGTSGESAEAGNLR